VTVWFCPRDKLQSHHGYQPVSRSFLDDLAGRQVFWHPFLGSFQVRLDLVTEVCWNQLSLRVSWTPLPAGEEVQLSVLLIKILFLAVLVVWVWGSQESVRPSNIFFNIIIFNKLFESHSNPE
jgi:hypothetical protein